MEAMLSVRKHEAEETVDSLLVNIKIQFFILVINQLDGQNLFYNNFISSLYMFRAYVLIVRRSKLYYTASGIIIPIGGRPVHRLRCTVNMLKAAAQRKTKETADKVQRRQIRTITGAKVPVNAQFITIVLYIVLVVCCFRSVQQNISYRRERSGKSQKRQPEDGQ